MTADKHMGQKIKLDDNEYDVENLSDQAAQCLSNYQFANLRIQELLNMQALLNRAKASYVEELKREMLSKKGGFFFEE